MNRIVILVAFLLTLSGPALAGAIPASAESNAQDFRWTSQCDSIPSPRIVVCRVVPAEREGFAYHGPFVPVTFQIDNTRGRSVTINGVDNCLEKPAELTFGDNPPFEIPPDGALDGAQFDRIIAEFRAAKVGTVKYSPLPDCKPVTAKFYYSNLDDALTKAMTTVNGGGSS